MFPVQIFSLVLAYAQLPACPTGTEAGRFKNRKHHFSLSPCLPLPPVFPILENGTNTHLFAALGNSVSSLTLLFSLPHSHQKHFTSLPFYVVTLHSSYHHILSAYSISTSLLLMLILYNLFSSLSQRELAKCKSYYINTPMLTHTHTT